MRTLTDLLVTGAFLLLVASCSPQPEPGTAEVVAAPEVKTLRVTLRPTLAADSLWVKGCFTTSGAPDSVITRVTGPVAKVHRLGMPVTCDSFTVPAPALLQTTSGTFTVQPKRRALLATVASRSWTYTTPDEPPPPAIIDSVAVRPLSVQLQPGQTQRFCAFVGFRSGSVAMRAKERGDPTCEAQYLGFPLAAREKVSTAEQLKADNTCITWQAEGGTITQEEGC